MLNVGVLMETSVVFFEAHGGKIWGENNTDGKGARFFFSLPSEGNDNNTNYH